jgi:hypothetical protein
VRIVASLDIQQRHSGACRTMPICAQRIGEDQDKHSKYQDKLSKDTTGIKDKL